MTTWKLTKNRGFYYGPAASSPWVNDFCWRAHVQKESAMQSKFLGDSLGLEDQPSARSGMSRASKGSKAAKGTRSHSVMGYSDLPDNYSSISEIQHELDTEGLDSQEKSQVLIRALQKERHERRMKEKQFVRMLEDEKKAREVAEVSMQHLASKLDSIAAGLGLESANKSQKGFLRRTRMKV